MIRQDKMKDNKTEDSISVELDNYKVEEYKQLSFFDVGRSNDMKVIEVLQESSDE